MLNAKNRAIDASDEALSVTTLNQQVKSLIESSCHEVLVIGEVSTFSAPVSGHWYFTLKDERSQVKCAMFRNQNQRYTQLSAKTLLKQGDAVIVSAMATLYPARGEYQLVVDHIRMTGDGVLQQRLAQLKRKLAQEGLFDLEHKKAIPQSPRCVGVITSSTGAALYDIMHVLHRRDPSVHLIIYPALVQGSEATDQLIAALALANRRKECEVLLLGRGGGSLEDLWCFNEERLVRAIFASEIPVISAVGHEVDFTLSDQVADLRAATPSAAAEAISVESSVRKKEWEGLLNQLLRAIDYRLEREQRRFLGQLQALRALHPQKNLERQKNALQWLQQKLLHALEQTLQSYAQPLAQATHRLCIKNPLASVAQRQHQSTQQFLRLTQGISKGLLEHKERLTLLLTRLQGRSPAATLLSGYAWVSSTPGQVLRSVDAVRVHDVLDIHLVDGSIQGRVEQISKKVRLAVTPLKPQT